MRYIGGFYKSGYGAKQDYSKAMKYYLKAADQGNLCAFNNVGILYKNGYGVKQDYSKAMDYYLKAAESGYSAALFNIGHLYFYGYGVKQDYSKAMDYYLHQQSLINRINGSKSHRYDSSGFLSRSKNESEHLYLSSNGYEL